jgi:hypothetical protein
MPHSDWRSPDTYDRARDLEPTGLAWECLRRNPDYHRDYHKLTRSKSGPIVSTAFRRRWGLCFCG